MPIFKRPEAESHSEVHGSGHPLLPFTPRGPDHLAESIRRVTAFLTKHTPR
jgi:hypothetical protein